MADYVDISPNKDGGLMKKIITPGGKDEFPGPGDTVFVHYVGTLDDGSKFDSSRDRNEQFKFELGKGSVIKGWDIGVATMKRGEKADFIIKSDYGYGKTGSPPKIAPDATLHFEIELYDWKGEDLSPDKDGSITRHTINKGEGYQMPNDGASVKISLIARFNDKEVDRRDVDFVVGDGCESMIPEGVEIALKKFKKSERSIIKINNLKYGFGTTGCQTLNIPGGPGVLEYDLTLTDFEKAKESWQMDSEEKLVQSEQMKQKGSEFFKKEKFKLAINYYNKIVSFLEYETTFAEDKKERRANLMLAAHNNLSLCNLKIGNDLEALKNANKALEFDANNDKALFRKASALLNMAEFDQAKSTFVQLLNLEPNNVAAKQKLEICKQKIKAQNEKDKSVYRDMFKKFAAMDEKVGLLFFVNLVLFFLLDPHAKVVLSSFAFLA